MGMGESPFHTDPFYLFLSLRVIMLGAGITKGLNFGFVMSDRLGLGFYKDDVGRDHAG